MSNFSPKLQDATDEQLLHMVNELDFRVVPLASDELTRRTVRKLQEAIEVSNEHSQKIERSNYKLQQIMVVLTAIGPLAVVFPVLQTLFGWSAFVISQMFRLPLTSVFTTNLLAGITSALVASFSFFKFGGSFKKTGGSKL